MFVIMIVLFSPYLLGSVVGLSHQAGCTDHPVASMERR